MGKYDIMFIWISMNTYKYMCVLIHACVYIFVNRQPSPLY